MGSLYWFDTCLCFGCNEWLLPSPAWAEGIVLGLCVCVCVLPQNCCLIAIISKSKEAASHKLGNLRQKVVLYKTGKFLQASMAQIVWKIENKNNSHDNSYTKGEIKNYSTWKFKWGRKYVGISTVMLVCEDMTSCTDLAHHHVFNQITTLCRYSA